MDVPSSPCIHPDIRVRRTGLRRTTDRFSTQVAHMSTGLVYRVYNNTLDNCLEAINRRIFYTKFVDGVGVLPPLPTCDVQEVLRPVYRILRSKIRSCNPMTYDQVIMSYTGAKRRIYQRARDRLLTAPQLESSYRINGAFGKGLEKQQDGKIIRAITSPPPEVLLQLHIYIKRIEKMLVYLLDSMMGGATIAKGRNAYQVAGMIQNAWESFTDPVGIGADASRFDQHVSTPLLEWEFSIYKMFFPADAVLEELLSRQLKSRARARVPGGFISYKVTGTRTSGVPNTGLGNCLLMVSMLYSWAKRQGIKVRLINNGDDCMIITERRDEQRLREGFVEFMLSLGFTMVLEPTVDVLEKVVFCQSQPVWTPQGYLMVRQIDTAIPKDTTCALPLRTRKEYEQWVGAVADGGLALAGGIPIYHEFYRALKRAAGKTAPKLRKELVNTHSYSYQMQGNMNRKDYSVHDKTRLSFYLAFGYTPAHQIAIETGVYSKVTPTYNKPERSFEHHGRSHTPWWELRDAFTPTPG